MTVGSAISDTLVPGSEVHRRVKGLVIHVLSPTPMTSTEMLAEAAFVFTAALILSGDTKSPSALIKRRFRGMGSEASPLCLSEKWNPFAALAAAADFDRTSEAEGPLGVADPLLPDE